ncbi:hypothetical protein JX265_007907 [Neoarthrinium moseri]|uniref:Uncharacterized protein n=1 Tax=Neoarthrinium moseri TaxID=1658444 RepID=A0A9P9WIS9_9PEZI|nr:hypothetical protein JX265_007907 [Neoarthrinium moseri]
MADADPYPLRWPYGLCAERKPFWYTFNSAGVGSLKYGGNSIVRMAADQLQEAYHNDFKDVPKIPRWFQGQLMLYGVKTTRGGNKKEALSRAIAAGLCDAPSPAMQRLETRLRDKARRQDEAYNKAVAEWETRKALRLEKAAKLQAANPDVGKACEAGARVNIKQENIKQENTVHQGIKQEVIEQEVIKQEVIKQEVIKQEHLDQDNLNHETTKQEDVDFKVLKQEDLKRERD